MYRGEIVETGRRRPGDRHARAPLHAAAVHGRAGPDPDQQEQRRESAARSWTAAPQQDAAGRSPDPTTAAAGIRTGHASHRHTETAPSTTATTRRRQPDHRTAPHALLAELTLEEKVRLIRAPTSGPPCPLPEIGLRSMVAVRRPGRRPRSGLGRARPVAQPPVGDGARRRPGTSTSPTGTARPRHPRPVARASTSCSARPSTCTGRRWAAGTSSASARTRC